MTKQVDPIEQARAEGYAAGAMAQRLHTTRALATADVQRILAERGATALHDVLTAHYAAFERAVRIARGLSLDDATIDEMRKVFVRELTTRTGATCIAQPPSHVWLVWYTSPQEHEPDEAQIQSVHLSEDGADEAAASSHWCRVEKLEVRP